MYRLSVARIPEAATGAENEMPMRVTDPRGRPTGTKALMSALVLLDLDTASIRVNRGLESPDNFASFFGETISAFY